MNATILDVSRKAGLSSATVSRVINNSPLVSPKTRARVQAAIDELGYRPSHAARTLVRRRSDTLGVVFPLIAGGFYADLLRGIDAVAATHDLHLLTAFAHGTHDQTALIDRMLHDGRVDALILLNLDLPDTFLHSLRHADLPVVLIDRPSPATHFGTVSIDNRSGAAAAITHLLHHHYTDIAILTGPPDNHDSIERLDACRTAAAQWNHTIPDTHIHPGYFTMEGGRRFLANWLATHPAPPRAILALNDAMAFGVYSLARERGLRVPEDIALTGFDDIEAAALIGLTTVHVPIEEMGRVAGTMAIERMRAEHPAHGAVMPTHLVTRTTCGCPP